MWTAAVLLFAGLSSLPSLAGEFPRVPSLEPNVAFWKKVYARWSVNEVAFHDREDLRLVYRVVKVPPRSQPQARHAAVKQAQQELEAALRSLERKRPTSEEGLEGVEREVYRNLKDIDRDDKYRRLSLIRAQNGLYEQAREGYIRFGRYERHVRAKLQDAGLPEELVALAFVESLFNLYARSHAGATGIWQFVPATAREYMQVHHVLDERYDPVLSTEAAAQYLNQARKVLGPWPLAITSYNYGRAGMARAVKATGSTDLGVIVERYEHPRFGFAAKNYYACFLAFLEVLKEPERYFPGARPHPPWRYDVVRLPFSVLATQLYEAGVITKKQLGALNPALTRAAREGKEVLPRGLSLRVPFGKGSEFLAGVLAFSADTRRAAERHVRRWHFASGRETIQQIARRYGVSAELLARTSGYSARQRPKRGTKIPIPSVPVRYTLLPEARVLEIPKAPPLDEERVAERSGAPAMPPLVEASREVARAVPPGRGARVKLLWLESVPLLEPLPSVDAVAGQEASPAGVVDFVAGDPGPDAPWPLYDERPPPAEGDALSNRPAS